MRSLGLWNEIGSFGNVSVFQYICILFSRDIFKRMAGLSPSVSQEIEQYAGPQVFRYVVENSCLGILG